MFASTRSGSRRTSRVLVALLAIALLAAACGGDDDDDAVGDDTTTTTTEAADVTTTTEAAETTTTEAGAGDPPSDVGSEDEGLGDPLVFIATLSGEQEVPGPGDAAGTGRVEIESDLEGRLCFDMVATELDADVTGAHIHEAAAGASGGVVIDIGLPTASDGDTDTWSDVCVAVADDVRERMNAAPSNFYANVHTTTFADGAVRGQLEQATIFDLELS